MIMTTIVLVGDMAVATLFESQDSAKVKRVYLKNDEKQVEQHHRITNISSF